MFSLDNFHYEVTGNPSGSKLVFLHGLMGYSANWHRMIEYLKSDYCILTYDQRGHGRSFHPETGYTTKDYADDLHSILHELKWSQTFVVGHSMGGRNAVHFASLYPHMVKKLVIEDIGPVTPIEAAQRVEKILNAVPTPFESQKEAQDYFSGDFRNLFRNPREADLFGLFFFSNIMRNGNGTYDWRFSKQGILETVRFGAEKSRWNEWEHCSVPTLLIRGEHSDQLSQKDYETVLQMNRRLKGVTIPKSGHWVHADQPKLFAETVKNFLNGDHT